MITPPAPGTTPANKGRTLPAEPLTRAEVERLLRELGGGVCGHRNRALVGMLWRAGLRITEALSLYPKDVDGDGGTVTVLRGKGGRRRQVALDGYAVALLDPWLTARAQLGIDRRAPLFCTVTRGSSGRSIHAEYVRHVLARAGERAGILKRVHPHGLRHSCAFDLLMEGQPLGAIKAQLGHAQLATTMRYLDHLGNREAIQAIRARPAPGPSGFAAAPRPAPRS